MCSQEDFNNLLVELSSQRNVPAIIKTLQQIHQYVKEEMVGDPTKLTLSHMQRLYGALNRLQIFNEETIQYWLPIVQISIANKLPEKIFLHYYIQKFFSFFTIYRNFQEHQTIINLCFELLLKLSDGLLESEDPKLDLSKEYEILISLIKNLQLNNPSNNTMDHFPSICKVFTKYLVFFPKEEVFKDTYFWIGISLNNIISDHKNLRDSGQLVIKALLSTLSEFSDKINNKEQSSKLLIKDERLKEFLKPRADDPKNEWANLLKLFIELGEILLHNSSAFINIIFISLLEGFKIQGERERELSIECWLKALPLLIKTPHLDAKKRTHILEIIFTNLTYNINRPYMVKLQLSSIWYLIKTYQINEKDYTEILQDFILKMFGSHVPKKGKELNVNRNKNICPQEYCNVLAQYLAHILDPQPGSPKSFLWTSIPPATKAILSYNHLSRLTPQIIHCVLVTLESMASKDEYYFDIQDFICSSLITHLIDEKVLKIYPEGLKRLFRSMITLLLKCKDQPKLRPILLDSILRRIIHQVPTHYLFSPSHSLVVHQQGGLATPVHFFLEILLCNMFIELPQAKPLINELISLLSNSEHCLELVSTLSRVFNQDLQEKRSEFADRCIIKLWTKLPELVIKNQSSFEILKDSSIEILSTPLQRLNFIPRDEQSAVLEMWRVYLNLSLKTHADIFIPFSERLISIIPWMQLNGESLELSTRFLLVLFDNYPQNLDKSLSSKDLCILVQLLERAMALSIDETENEKIHQLTIDNLCKCLANLLNFIDHSHLSIVCNAFCGFIIETLTRATDAPLLLLWEKFFEFIKNGIKEINSSELIFAISELCQKAVNGKMEDLAIKTKIFLQDHLFKQFPNENCISSIKIPESLMVSHIENIPKENNSLKEDDDDEIIPSSQPLNANNKVTTGLNFGSPLSKSMASKITTPSKRVSRTPKPKEYSDYVQFPPFKRTRERKVSKDIQELNDTKNVSIKDEKKKTQGSINKKIKPVNDSNSLEKLNELVATENTPSVKEKVKKNSSVESKKALKMKNIKNLPKGIDSILKKMNDDVGENNPIENIMEISKNVQTTINPLDDNLEKQQDSDTLEATESSKVESSKEQEKIVLEIIEEKTIEPNNETALQETLNEDTLEDQNKEKVIPEKSVEEKIEKLMEEKIDEPIEEKIDEPIEEEIDEPIEEEIDEPIEEKIDEPMEEKIDEEPRPSTSDKKDILEEKFHSMKLTAGLRAAIMVAMSKNSPLPEASTTVIQPAKKKSPKANRLFVGYKSPRAAKMLKMAKEQDGKNDSCELDQMELLNHSFETLDQREETPSVPIKKSRRTRRLIPKSGNIIKNISPQIKKLIVTDKESDVKMDYVDWNPPPSPHPDSIPQRSALRLNKTKTPSKGVRFLKSEVSNLLVFTYSDHNDSIERFQDVLEDVKGKYKDSDSEEKNSESNIEIKSHDNTKENENSNYNNKTVENNSDNIHSVNQEDNQLEEPPTEPEEKFEILETNQVLENDESNNEELNKHHEENYELEEIYEQAEVIYEQPDENCEQPKEISEQSEENCEEPEENLDQQRDNDFLNNKEILEINEELTLKEETYHVDALDDKNDIDSYHQLTENKLKKEQEDEMPELTKKYKTTSKLDILLFEAEKATKIKTIDSPRQTRMSSQRTTRSSNIQKQSKILKKKLKKSTKIIIKNTDVKEISTLILNAQKEKNERENTLENAEDKTISGEISQKIENQESDNITESEKNSIQLSSSSSQENDKEPTTESVENKTKNQINNKDSQEPSVSNTITNEHPSEDIKTKRHKRRHIVENSSEDESIKSKIKSQTIKEESSEPSVSNTISNEHPSQKIKTKKRKRGPIVENNPNPEQITPRIKRRRRSIKDYFNKTLDTNNSPYFTSTPNLKIKISIKKEENKIKNTESNSDSNDSNKTPVVSQKRKLIKKKKHSEDNQTNETTPEMTGPIHNEKNIKMENENGLSESQPELKKNIQDKLNKFRKSICPRTLSEQNEIPDDKENLPETSKETCPNENLENLNENSLKEILPVSSTDNSLKENVPIENSLKKNFAVTSTENCLMENLSETSNKNSLKKTLSETPKENISETVNDNSFKQNLPKTSNATLKENFPETSNDNSLSSTISCEIQISDDEIEISDDEIEILHVCSSPKKLPLKSSSQEIPSSPQETRSSPQETKSSPQEARSSPQETRSSPQETQSSPQETQLSKQEIQSPTEVTQVLDTIPLESKNSSIAWFNLSSDHILYEKLKDSTEPIETLIPRLFIPVGPQNSEKIARLSIDFKIKSLKTIGDLARLTVSQVKNLPLPQPRVLLALHTLKCFDSMPRFRIRELELILKRIQHLTKQNRLQVLASLMAEFPEVAYDYVTPYTLIKSLPNFLTASEVLIPFMCHHRRTENDHIKFIVPILRSLMKKFTHKTIMDALILAYPKDDIINDFNNHSLVQQILDHQGGRSPDVRIESPIPSTSEENKVNVFTNDTSTISIDNVTSLNQDSAIEENEINSSYNESSTTELIEADLSLNDSKSEPMEVEIEAEPKPENNFFLTSLNPEEYLKKSENFTLEQLEHIQNNIIQILSLTHNKIQSLKANNTPE